MSAPILLNSDDPLIAKLNFKPYRSTVERRVKPFLPKPGEPQTMELQTPWGSSLTVKVGDFLVSELSTPNDCWPIDARIFEETYLITRPGFCVKNALTLLVPLVDVTKGNADEMVTVVTLEGPETVRAGDFYLAKGVKGEVWPYPIAKVKDVMMPIE